MPKFVIERDVPGTGPLSAEALRAIATKSKGVLDELGHEVQWVHTYVTDDKWFCVYNAKDESLVREHARRGGFACDEVRSVSAVIDPVTGGA